jgi:uncharacterized membrane protein YphA (DoxX/SURF4 family)
VGLAARLILGGVIFVAGALKVGAIGESILAVRAFRILPYELTSVVGTILPFAEILLGLLIMAGVFTRMTGILGALLMLAFTIAIISAWSRGLTLDCGCFGGGGVISQEEAFAAYPWDIARDIGLMACGVWLAIFPRTAFSVDNWIFGVSHADASDEDASLDPVSLGTKES